MDIYLVYFMADFPNHLDASSPVVLHFFTEQVHLVVGGNDFDDK